ncbi:hypothetical protein BDFB_014547, partial [Asbolus verrucosus]
MGAKLMLCGSTIFQIALKSYEMDFRELFFNMSNFNELLIILNIRYQEVLTSLVDVLHVDELENGYLQQNGATAH